MSLLQLAMRTNNHAVFVKALYNNWYPFHGPRKIQDIGEREEKKPKEKALTSLVEKFTFVE